MKKKCFKIVISSITLIPTAISPVILSCSCFSNNRSNQDIMEHYQIYNFLNDRTFSIGAFWNYNDIPSSEFGYVVGTTWIFYHAPESKFQNNYTYYALTNLHVAGCIDYFINNTNETQDISDCYVCLSYQKMDEIQKSKTLIDFTEFNSHKDQYGSSKTFAIDHVDYSAEQTTTNYASLFAQYSTMDGVDSTIARRYFDAVVIKLNLNTAASKDQTLKDRLNRLNEYANQNNNYVLKFQEPNQIDNVKDVYSLGYPVRRSDEKCIYDDNHISAQVIRFSNMGRKLPSNFAIFGDEIPQEQECLTPNKYGGDKINYNTHDNAIYLAGTNLSTNNYIYDVKNWGGGSSGSCGLYVENEADESTYKTMGIFWGTFFNSDESWWMPGYQSFAYNWGTEENLIDNFMYFMDNEYSETCLAKDKFVGTTPQE